PCDLVDEPLARRGVALVAQQPASDRLPLDALHDDARALAGDPVRRRYGHAGVVGGPQRGELAGPRLRVLQPGRVAAQDELVAVGARQHVEAVELARRAARERHERLDPRAVAVVLARLFTERLL